MIEKKGSYKTLFVLRKINVFRLSQLKKNQRFLTIPTVKNHRFFDHPENTA